MCAHFKDVLDLSMGKQLAWIDDEIDTRSSCTRLRECSFGSICCDIMMKEMSTAVNRPIDIALLNGGTIRTDKVYPPGPFTAGTLISILPFEDIIIAIEATGAQVRAALENGVSRVPQQDGRFPQVAGLAYSYDAALPPGHRLTSLKLLDGRKFEDSAVYVIALKTYMTSGKDGYKQFTECTKLVDDESGYLLSTMFRVHLLKLKAFNQLRGTKNVAIAAAERFLSHSQQHAGLGGDAAYLTHLSSRSVSSKPRITALNVPPPPQQ